MTAAVSEVVPTMSSLVRQMLREQKRWIYAMLALATVGGALAIFTVATIHDVFDHALVQKDKNLDELVSTLVSLAFLTFIVGIASRLVAARIGYHLEYRLRVILLDRIVRAASSSNDAFVTGQILTRAQTDLYFLEAIIVILPILPLIAVTLLILIVYLVVISPLLAVVTLSALPVNAWLVNRIRRRLWGLNWTVLNRRAEVTAAIDEAVRGIRVVKAYASEDRHRSTVKQASLAAYAVAMSKIRLLARYSLALIATPIVANAATLLVAGRLVASGQATVGDIVVVLALAGGLTGVIGGLDGPVDGWQATKSGAGRIFDLFLRPADDGGAMAARVPAEGVALRLDGVSIVEGGNEIVEHLAFEARPGELLLVEAKGAVADLVAAVVTGARRPDAGLVHLGDLDIAELATSERRAAIRTVDAVPYIFARSLRDNVAVGQVERHDSADGPLAEALAMAGGDELLAELRGGLDTILSDRGLNLSGGQRQRVGLARALVERPAVLVLHEALSAVNPALRADIIMRIKLGRPETAIVYIGTRTELEHLADRRIDLLAAGVAGAAGAQGAEGAEEISPYGPSIAAAPPASQTRDGRLDAILAALPEGSDLPAVDEAEATESDETPGVRRLLWPFRWRVAAVAVFITAFTLAGLAPGGFNKIVFDDFKLGRHNNADKVALALVGVAVLAGLGKYAFSIFLTSVNEGIVYVLRRRTFERLCRLGIDYYDRSTPGAIAAKVVYDLDKISAFLETGVDEIALAVSLLLVTGIVLTAWNASVATLVLAFFPVLLVLTLIQAPLAHRAYRAVRASFDEVMRRFQDEIAGRDALQQYGAVDRASGEFVTRAWSLRQARRKATIVSNVYLQLITLVGALATAALLSRAGSLALAGTISIGSVVALQSLLQGAVLPIPLLSQATQLYLEARASFATLREPYDAAIPAVERAEGEASPTLRGGIAFEAVDFAYPLTSVPVLRDVSFSVETGEVLALVGPTGAGKSSVAKLAARLYDPDSGSVLVDGVDIRRYNARSYRRRVGTVLQEEFCFRASVYENVAYGRPDADRDEVEGTLGLIGAADVLALPGGIDAPIDEEGANLTVVQRQMIAIARAIVAQPDFYVLDEATSSLPEEREQSVLEALRAQGSTVLIVTHRLSVAAASDTVAYVDHGTIIGAGPHDELLESNDAYRQLWASTSASARARIGERAPTRRRRARA